MKWIFFSLRLRNWSTCHQMWWCEGQWKNSSRLREHPLRLSGIWEIFFNSTSLQVWKCSKKIYLKDPFTRTGSGEYPLQRKFCVTIGLTEIWVVLLSSFTKSVMELKWTTARLQTPSLQGPQDRSNPQEDRDRSAPKYPSKDSARKTYLKYFICMMI